MSDLRASFEERDAYLDQLARAYADGRLDDEEFARRRDIVLSATMHGEMLAQFDGLPAPRVRHVRPARARVPRPVPTMSPPVQREPTPGIGRRAVLAGGIIALILGGLVLQDRTRFAADPDFAATAHLPLDRRDGVNDVDLERTIASLRDRGLTRIADFHADPGSTYGTAIDPADPERLTAFERPSGGSLRNPWRDDSWTGPTVDINEFQELVADAVDTATEHFGGEGRGDLSAVGRRPAGGRRRPMGRTRLDRPPRDGARRAGAVGAPRLNGAVVWHNGSV